MFGPDVLATLGTLYDDIVYLTLGKAIASGEGYRSLHLVGTPVHAKFPPLLPLLYAGIWLVTPWLDVVVYAAYGLSMLALGAATWILWRYAERLGIRWWLTTILVLGPLLLLRTVRYFAGAVSEPWFLLGWAGALLVSATFEDARQAGQPPRDGHWAALGLLLAAATLARSQAIVLLPAVLLAQVVRRVPVRAIVATGLGAAAPLALWRVWHGRMLAAGPVSTGVGQLPYTDWLSGGPLGTPLTSMTLAARANPAEYLEHAARMLVGWTSGKAELLILGFGLLTLAGLALAARRRPEFTLSVAGVCAVLLVWPFNQARFLTTLLPFLGLAAALALEAGLTRSPRWAARVAATALAGLAAALGVINLGARASALDFQSSPGSLPHAIGLATAWIERETGPADHILVDYGAVYFLRTGRRTSIAYPEQPFTAPSVLLPPGRYLARRILADSVDFVVDARPSERRLGPQVEALTSRCPGALRPLDPVPPAGTDAPRYYAVAPDRSCLVELSNELSAVERALGRPGD